MSITLEVEHPKSDTIDTIMSYYETESIITASDDELLSLGDTALTLLGTRYPMGVESETQTDFTREYEAFGLKVNLSPDEATLLRLFSAQPWTPLTSAELRREGFEGSTLETRRALHSLMKKLNNEDRIVLQVGGQTKGTHYTLQSGLLSTELTDEDSIDEEFERVPERVLLIKKLLDRYAHHPLVTRSLGFARKPDFEQRLTKDSFGDYIKSIGAYELLTREDEDILFTDLNRAVELFETKQEDFSAPEELLLIHGVTSHQLLFRTNQRLAVSKAKEYFKSGMDPLDIIQEANEGLLDAIARFDLSKGFKLSTYALFWIRHKVTRGIMDKSTLVRVPVYKHEEMAGYRQLIDGKETELGRKLISSEIEELIGIPYDEYRDVQQFTNSQYVELDAPLTASDEGTYADVIVLPSESVEHTVIKHEIATLIARYLEKADMTDEQRFIVGLRNGIDPSLMPELIFQISKRKQITYEEAINQTFTTGGQMLDQVARMLKRDRVSIRKHESIGMAALREVAGITPEERVDRPNRVIEQSDTPSVDKPQERVYSESERRLWATQVE